MTITCPRCSASYSLEEVVTLDKQLSCVCGAVFDVQTALLYEKKMLLSAQTSILSKQKAKIEETHLFMQKILEIEEAREQRFQESERKKISSKELFPFRLGKDTSLSSIFILFIPFLFFILSGSIDSDRETKDIMVMLGFLSIVPSIILAGVVNNIYRIAKR